MLKYSKKASEPVETISVFCFTPSYFADLPAMPVHARVQIHYGPYEACGIVEYRTARLEGMQSKYKPPLLQSAVTGRIHYSVLSWVTIIMLALGYAE